MFNSVEAGFRAVDPLSHPRCCQVRRAGKCDAAVRLLRLFAKKLFIFRPVYTLFFFSSSIQPTRACIGLFVTSSSIEHTCSTYTLFMETMMTYVVSKNVCHLSYFEEEVKATTSLIHIFNPQRCSKDKILLRPRYTENSLI